MRSWTHSKGFVGAELRQQEPRPAAVARVRGEQLGQGGAGRRGQAPALAQPAWGAGRFSAARLAAAGDQGKACCHTTHNVFVLLLFFIPRLSGQESMEPRLGRALFG